MIKEIRTTYFKSQAQAARFFGVHQPNWHRWETGERPIPRYVVRLLEFFETFSERQKRQLITKFVEEDRQDVKEDAGTSSLK